MSAAVARVRPCSCRKGGPAGATPSAQQARTMHTPESQMGRARHAAAATARADSLSGAISSEHPNHLSNISLYSFFSEWTESGNWASARPTAFGWTKDATHTQKKKKKLNAAFEKRHNEL